MPQDAAGKPYVYAALIFAGIVVLMGIVLRSSRSIPGGKWILLVGASIIVLGTTLLLYFTFLALRSGSAKNSADYEQYLESVRNAESGWSPKADAPPEKAEP